MSRKSINRICIGAYFNILCIEEQGAFLLETLQIAGITGRYANHGAPIVSLFFLYICAAIASSYFYIHVCSYPYFISICRD